MTGYVKIKRYDHYGELAVPTGVTREKDGVVQAEFILLDCKHKQHREWFIREDIG